MKVLIADKLPECAQTQLCEAGCDVIYAPELKGSELTDRLNASGAEVLIVRSTRVTTEMLVATTALGLIVRAGAGTNTIAVLDAAARGIYVANCPGKNAEAVAELAFGLMLAADRQIPNNVADLRAGLWRKKHYCKHARGLHGRTLGLVGMGNIGRAMVPKAKAFGMQVVAWSRSLTKTTAAQLGVNYAESPLEVAKRSDVLSVHVALTEETHGLIDRPVLEAMRPGGIFLNTSRGGVVDEDALLDAMRHRALRCGLDVFATEPGANEPHFQSPLMAEPLCFGTHHIGASTEQSQEAVAMEAARVVLTYKTSGLVPNCINLTQRSEASHTLIVRHHDEVGVLACVLERLRTASINVQEMENTIFAGGHAAIARIQVQGCPCNATLALIRSAEHVLSVAVLETSTNGCD